MRPGFVLSILLLAAGCPDPEKPYDATGKGVDPNAGAGMGAPPPGGGAVAGADPQGVVMPALSVAPGEGVKLEGSFTYEGAQVGKLRVDFFRPGSDGKPEILHTLTLEQQGPWAVELPKNLGPVIVLAFVDATGNGPDAAEPSALRENVNVLEAPITDLAMVLADGAANPYSVDATGGPGATPAPVNAPPLGAEGGAPPAGGAPVPADGSAPAPAAPAPEAGSGAAPAAN